MKGCIISIFCLLAAAQAFVETGKQYNYDVEIRIGAGTMDHAPSIAGTIYRFKTRAQHPDKDTIRFEMSDMKYAQYVGPWDSSMNTDALTYLPSQLPTIQYSLHLENGLFKSLSMQDGLSATQRNIIKAWASNFQLNGENMMAGKANFKSSEESINGECVVSYTITSDTIYKSTVHNKDCKNFIQRRIDNVRGYDCDYEDTDKTEGIISTSNVVYEFEGKPNNRKITKLQSRGSFVAQMFETEGYSLISAVNITAVLTSDEANPGDIGEGSTMTNTLQYEFSDEQYQWNQDRNLKDAEMFFGSGSFLEDQNEAKNAVLKALKTQKTIFHDHKVDSEGVKRAHDYGVGQILMPMYTLDYNNLKSIFDQLMADSSTEGKMMSNIFNELLGSTGTTASAVLVMDLLKAKKFDNQRDAGRALSSIPFHIRRPNKQLVQELKKLLDTDQEDAVKMAMPLAYAHLVRITCERAGKKFPDTKIIECAKDIGRETAQYLFDKFKSTNDRKLKNLYLASLQNLRWGGHSKLLKPVIYGETGDESEFRSQAIWAVIHELAHKGQAFNYLFPVFAEKKNDHEVRMSAVNAIMMLKPSSTEVAKIVNILSTETDFEVINGVFALLEMKSKSISPCDRKVKHISGFFLKYLKQFSKYEVDYGFGVTKSYMRQFDKKKYGYGGAFMYYVNGAHDSTTPLSLGMSISSYVRGSYANNLFHVHLRIEGLAKSLIRKFKTADPTVWKTDDLKAIFTDMGIKERADQPLRASVTIMLKGTVVIQRSYDDSETGEGGKVTNFMEKIKDLATDYAINHQRVLTAGQVLVEQPNVIGLPVVYGMTLTTMMSLEANMKRGQNRGTFFGEIEYDAHLFTQGTTTIMLMNPDNKKVYAVKQDRVYHAHLPRKVTIGVNPLRKNLKIKVSRAKYDEPTMFFMHSETSVFLRGAKSVNPNVGIEDLAQNCPSCPSRMVVSNGNAKDREIVNRENSKYGYRAEAKYFDCEMDVARRNTVGRVLGAFMPYNKNPRTPFTMFTMGMRQIRAFLLYFPRAEKCGVMAKFSQSKTNPVREVEIEITGSKESKGERLFLRGGLLKAKIGLKAIGDQTRAYRLTISRQTSPGDLKIATKVKFDRAKNSVLGISPYTVCISYKAQYPSFSKEMFDVDMSSTLKMEGEAKIQYGAVSKCDKGEGEVVANFEYSTTQEARESLKNKWYYKDCMAKKNSPAWQGRSALPVSHSCYLTAYDATNARRYKYDIQFKKMTDRAKSIIEKVRFLVRTLMMPYYENEDDSTGEIGPFLKMDVTLKEDDKVADAVFETSQGTKNVKDYPLRLPWSKRLRNLKFTKTFERLLNMGIIKPCQLTSQYVQTMDNVTYPLETPSCWTLMSGHCGPNPSYAVFVKKNSGKPLAMKAYIGGHTVEIDPNSKSVKVNGNGVSVSDTSEHKHAAAGTDIFKITKWGSTYNIYSFLRVWIVFDGNFVNVVPAPSVKGQHCGLCGNYNRDKYDEAVGKNGATDVGFSGIADEWKWKC